MPEQQSAGTVAELQLAETGIINPEALQEGLPPSLRDPLMACLQIIARHHQLPCNPEVALAGLPLAEGKLTPDLFGRAAARCGLDARIVERENIADTSTIVLPVILLLEGNRTCVLLNLDVIAQQAVIQTSLITPPETVSLHGLNSEYSGFMLLCRPAPDLKLAKPDSHWFWSALAKSWRIYRDVILASLLINVFAVVSPLFTMNVYDRVVPNRAMETLWVLVIAMTLVYCFDLLIRTLRVYFLEVAGKKADLLMSSSIFEQVMGIRMECQPASSGSFISQLREFESVRHFVTSTTVVALIDVPFALFFLVVIFLVGGWLVLVPLIIAPIMILYGYFMQPALRKAIESGYAAAMRKHEVLTEAITQRESIKSLVAEGHWQRLWEQATGDVAVSGQKGRLLTSSVTHVCGLLQQVAIVAAVTAGVYLIRSGDLSMGALIAVVMLLSRALAPMSQIVGLQAQYFQTRTTVDGLNKIMQLPVDRPHDRIYLQKAVIHGEIEFRHVSFAFSQDAAPALRDVSFRIRPGEKVAVIGRIGAGKSTLHKLALGLFQPTKGMVLIDGVDIRQMDPAFVRQSMSFMSQEFTLFHDSVRNNITRGELYPDDERLARVVRDTGVADFVRESALGLDMPVGEMGARLSGGQRQSVMLARTLFRDASIYLLDEPSSQMDSGSEDWIRQQLPAWTQEATVLLTTHKSSMLDSVERLIVLDRGRVVADGPRQRVLEALQKGEVKVSVPSR
jgi:ATP-binding cassette subfamily C protein LapB